MHDQGESHCQVSIVIPVLNAAPYLPELLKSIGQQEPAPPEEIILVDSGSTDQTSEIAARHPTVRVIDIQEFSHGRSRNLGVQAATGDIVVLMSQDAKPANSQWLASLIAPIGQDNVVATCARQVPRRDATPMEEFYLQKNFPSGNAVRYESLPGQHIGLRDVFFSNVSSAALRKVLLENPFDESLIMGEDQKFTKTILTAGYATMYVPSSVVIHSHRFSLLETFRRYFDSVYAIREIFPGHRFSGSAGIGMQYVTEEIGHLARHAPAWLGYYPLYVLTKAAATCLAHCAKHLPRPVLRKLSMHSYHWK